MDLYLGSIQTTVGKTLSAFTASGCIPDPGLFAAMLDDSMMNPTRLNRCVREILDENEHKSRILQLARDDKFEARIAGLQKRQHPFVPTGGSALKVPSTQLPSIDLPCDTWLSAPIDCPRTGCRFYHEWPPSMSTADKERLRTASRLRYDTRKTNRAPVAGAGRGGRGRSRPASPSAPAPGPPVVVPAEDP
jgi:hypothetical protein